jgi:hypothetical protein
MNIENSPHIFEFIGDIKNIKKATSFSRTLNIRSRRKKYEHMKVGKKKTIHDGQRKLLMSEIEFMTNEYHTLDKNNKILLYIGASAGERSIHTYTLAILFPEFEYHLYDKNDFYPRLTELKNVKIFKRWFTDNDSKNYKNKNVLLVSDMRDPDIGNYKNKSNGVNTKNMNKIVNDDMNIQSKFYFDINPASALLKFRLPWAPGKTEYLDGTIYYQVWQGLHSTETRLIPNGKIKKYDNTAYEERLFYFNTETRFRFYKHDYKCYGHCFDCISEITILENYIKLKKLKISICDLGRQITKELSFYKPKNVFTKPPLSKFEI